MRTRIHVLLHRHVHIHICMYTYMYMFTYMHLNLHCGRDGRLHSEYSRIRSSMLAYARVRSSILEYARVCSSMLEHARVRSSMLEYVRVFFCGYADRPLVEITLAAAEARPLHGPARSPQGSALQAPVTGGRGWLWSCGILCIAIGIVTGGFSFSMKPDGDQLAKAGPQQSDRCMELYALQWVADGSNQKLFDATACFESFLFPAVHVFCWWRHRPDSGLLGVRIGEAANPGPGAASATASRGREQMTQDALQTIIQLLLSMITVLAGENPAIKSQLAGIQTLMKKYDGRVC